MSLVHRLVVATTAVLLAGCTQARIYHSVHWDGQISTYPAADCVVPALEALPGITNVFWSEKQMHRVESPELNSRENVYSVSAKRQSVSLGVDLRIVQPTRAPRVLYSQVYYGIENPAQTAFGREVIGAIAARCGVPDLEQRLRFEHRQEPYLAPFWSD